MSIQETRAIYDSWYYNNITKLRAGEWDLLSHNIETERKLDLMRGLNLITFLSTDIQNKI